jgi:hypothetical protein
MTFNKLTYTAKSHATIEYIKNNDKIKDLTLDNVYKWLLLNDTIVYDERGDEHFQTFAFLDKVVNKHEAA